MTVSPPISRPKKGSLISIVLTSVIRVSTITPGSSMVSEKDVIG